MAPTLPEWEARGRVAFGGSPMLLAAAAGAAALYFGAPLIVRALTRLL